ncbi:MAG: hypothetical protein ACRDYB_14305, partial [Acidimicrobiales bacterium]
MTGLRAFQSQGGAEGVFELADPSPEPDFQRAPVRRPHLEAPLVKHLPLAAKTVGFLETPTGVNLLSGAEVPNSWC